MNSWWVSVDGIYRSALPFDEVESIAQHNDIPEGMTAEGVAATTLLHPKYKVPAACFAYVGDASKTGTWKLPYRLPSGPVDEVHLSGAIRAVLSNYRGAHVSTIPEVAVPDVLVRLGKAAAELRKLPTQTPSPLSTYQLLYDALNQVGRLGEVLR